MLSTNNVSKELISYLKLSVIYSELAQNLTIEERVAVLETQVVNIEEDLTNLDEDVNFLFDETVIQDERLLNLEEETSVINAEVEGLGSF